MKLSDSNINFIEEISASALLAVKKGDGKINAMTVSWGGAGVLWGREVCFIFVRQSRFTYGFCEEADVFTLSFFGNTRKEALAYCGRKSGRDTDKIKDCSFNVQIREGAVYFEDAKITVKIKKLYSDMIKSQNFVCESPLSNYKDGDFHKMYICEVEDVSVN